MRSSAIFMAEGCVGLLSKRETATLGAFVDTYIQSRIDVKPTTHRKYVSTRKNLVYFFGTSRNLRDISAGDADEWRLHLLGSGKAENTIRKHTAVAKLFLNAATRKGLVLSNPFADLKSAIQPNASRFYFVTLEEAQKVVDACLYAKWQLIFALSRYGGLRCPSEHLALAGATSTGDVAGFM